MGQIRQKLFFSGDDPEQFVDSRFDTRIIDAFGQSFVAYHNKQRGLAVNVRYEERGKIVIATPTIFFKGLVQLGFTFPELTKANLFNLRDAESDPPFSVFLAISGNGLRGRLKGEKGAGGKQFFRKLPGIHTRN